MSIPALLLLVKTIHNMKEHPVLQVMDIDRQVLSSEIVLTVYNWLAKVSN